MKNLAFLLLFLPILVPAQKVHYVLAPSGLNLRTSSDPSSAKIHTAQYGSQLEVLNEKWDKEMKIDGLVGGMVKVQHGEETGYMFSGYISPLPAPDKKMETEKYVDLLRNAGISYLYSFCREDYDGVFSVEEAFNVPDYRWQDAFLVAKYMYDIPKAFHFPGYDGAPGEKTISNPEKKDYVWSEDLMVIRDSSGKLKEIAYFRGQEGGGASVVISMEGEDGQLRVTYGQTAD